MVTVYGEKMIEFGAEHEARSLPKAGSMGPLQLGSRDHNFPKKSFILWAIT